MKTLQKHNNKVVNLQIIYSSSTNNINKIHPLFIDEAKAMVKNGICVGIAPLNESKRLIYRGTTIVSPNDYPKDPRFINTYEENKKCLFLTQYYPLISDLTISTFFVERLSDKIAIKLKQKGWAKAFIKKEITALEHIKEGKSVWPTTSFVEIESLYNKYYKFKGKYCIRKFIEPELLKKEKRYWVLNGTVYTNDNIVPDIVKEAALRLNKLGSKYYAIDATPEIIVEVNPGESSDRHAENPPELFASWFKNEFTH